MNTRTQAPSESTTRGAIDVTASLSALRERGATPVRYYREAAALVGRELEAPRVRIESSAQGQEITEEWAAPGSPESWEELVRAIRLELALDGETAARVVQDPSGPHLLVGTRIPAAPGAPGATMSIVVPCPSQEAAQRNLTAIQEVAAEIGRFAPLPSSASTKRRSPADDDAIDAGVARSAQYENPTQFAFKMVNSLRARLGATQVCFGEIRGRRSRIRAISGQDDTHPRNPELRAVRQAMDECVDHGEGLVAQDDDRWNDGALSSDHRLHAQWRDAEGGATVATFPLVDNEQVVAVISVVRERSQPFTRDERDSIAKLVAPYGAALRLLRRASRGIFRHGLESVYGAFAWAGSPRSLKLKASLIAVAALIAWIIFGTLPHTVTAPAVVKAGSLHHLGAPVEGRLSALHARPGDPVRAGQLLALFDTQEAELQERELRAERAALDVEIERATGSGERAEARVLRARRLVVDRRLEGARARIARASVRAPHDGVVVNGDLRDREGDVFTLGEPLFEIARNESVRLEVHVDERDWRFLEQANQGEFAPNAHPERGHALGITSTRGTAEVIDGHNAFVADAEFTAEADANDGPPLRPGMEGIVRLDAGERPVWWLASHRTIDWLRLKAWF